MRSAVPLLVLLMAACSRQESRAVKPLLRPPTTHGVVGLSYSPALDADGGLATPQQLAELRDGGVDFLWVDLGLPDEAGRGGATRGARALFEALARSRTGMRAVFAVEAPADAGVEAEQASLQQQADLVWREYANGAKFANHYQHLHGRPLLLVSVPVIEGSCAAGCAGGGAWNDRGQGRFTIRFVSAFLGQQGIADAFGRAHAWWSRRESGLPVWTFQDARAQPEHVGLSLEGGLESQWRRALDVDPTVVTLHGWQGAQRTNANLGALLQGARVARLRRSHAVLRDTKTGIWYFRAPPGFTVETTIPWVAGAHYEPLLCDFDGDGVQDLGLRDSSVSGRGTWHFKRGPGFTFESEWSFAWPSTAGTDSRALAGDFDGDGFCEIGVRHAPSGVITWRRPIPAAPERSFAWVAGAQLEPLVGDFDGDGKTDVALVDSSDGGLLRARYGPAFANERERPLAPGAAWFSGDFDGDGQSELGRYDFRDHGWGLGRFSIEWRDGGLETFEWASGQNYQVLAGDIR